MKKEKRILLIDHSTTQSFILHSILADEGYACSLAHGRHEALLFVRTHPYELILIDFDIQDAEDLSLISELESTPEYANIPVITLTAKEDMKNVAAFIPEYNGNHVTKPFNIQDLLTRISQIIK